MKPRLTYISVFVALAAIALILLWAWRTHMDGEARIPQILGDRFAPILNERYPSIETGPNSVRAIAEELQTAHPYIEEIVVLWMVPERGLVALYPPGYATEHPDVARNGLPNADAVAVRSGNERRRLVGTVYFRLDPTRSTLFSVALGLVIVLMMLVAAMGAVQIRSAGRQVRQSRTALRERERQLIHTERLALVGRATAALLHDLKKPVINIRDEIATLPPGPARDALSEETQFFFDLLSDWQLERFVAADRERGEFLDLREAIERSLRMASYAQRTVDVVLDIPDDLPDLFGQGPRLVQVFSNLILNAYQAMRGRGKLTVIGRAELSDGAQWIRLDVIDTGPGIAPNRRERVFEPFVSTGDETESMGLGLYITRSIVESMGGTVWADESPGSEPGAAFHLRLPLSNPEDAAL